MSGHRVKYSMLRWGRIVVSLVVLAVLTATVSWGVQWCTPLYEAIENVQFVPAAVRYSMVTFVVWLVITLLFGRVYCSTVCPLGTLQDVAARSMRIKRNKRPYRYSEPKPGLRYGALAVMVVCMFTGFWLAVSLLDPYELYVRFCTDTFAPLSRAALDGAVAAGIVNRPIEPILLTTFAATALSALLMVAVLMVAARSGRTICNSICPVGTTLSVVSRYAVWQMDIDTDLCTQCGKCVDVCKGSCINLTDHVVDGSRCVMCMDCVDVCEDDAINYTWRRKQLADPMMQRIGKPKSSAPVLEQTSNCVKNLSHNKTIENETIS